MGFLGGTPRKINVLCDNALLIGFGLAKKKVDAEIIIEVINDLSWSPFISAPEQQGSLPVKNQEPHQENDKAALSQEVTAKDFTPHERKFIIREGHAASVQVEAETLDKLVALQDVPRARTHGRQSGLMAVFLIIVFLVIIAWFIFNKLKLNIGENISLHSQNTVQAEMITDLKRAFNQFSDEVSPLTLAQSCNKRNG